MPEKPVQCQLMKDIPLQCLDAPLVSLTSNAGRGIPMIIPDLIKSKLICKRHRVLKGCDGGPVLGGKEMSLQNNQKLKTQGPSLKLIKCAWNIVMDTIQH